MKTKPSKFWGTAVVWLILLASFFTLLFYISSHERVEVFDSRNYSTVETVKDVAITMVQDDRVPGGEYRRFSFTLDKIRGKSASLCFYLVHNGARVYVDGTIVYGMVSSPNNQISHTPGSHWVCIPLSVADEDCIIQVDVIPAFPLAKYRSIDFVLGNRFSVFVWQLLSDLPLMLLSFLCIVLGAGILMTRLYFKRRLKTWRYDLFYLGIFSILLGFWRIGDLRLSPWIFSNYPMELSYATQSLLIISLIPLMYFMCNLFPERAFRPLHYSALVFSLLIALSPLLQFFEVCELRQVLPFVCLMLVVCDLEVIIIYLRTHRGIPRTALLLICILVGGSLADVGLLLWAKSFHGVTFQMISFLIFTGYLYVYCISEANSKAYTDGLTGLLNKARWEFLLEQSARVREPVAVVMIDLNGLKQVNDNMGHEAGDKLIIFFSNILKKAVTSGDFVCRWGGDEFSILIRDASQAHVDQCLAVIQQKVDAYNQLGLPPRIDFAAGYAISTDHPKCNRKDLFRLADEMMYANKQEWYKTHTR